MDAEGRIIPIVEDDQGEGYKDLYEEEIEKIKTEQMTKQMKDLEKLLEQKSKTLYKEQMKSK